MKLQTSEVELFLVVNLSDDVDIKLQACTCHH